MGREFRLGQELYFVLWDDDSEEAGVAKGEIVEYASDHSKVRVKVVEAPQRTVIGRTTWVLPDRLDDDPRLARQSYQRRAREQMRQEAAEQAGAESEEDAAARPREEAGGVAGAAQESWQRVTEGWRDVDLLVDTIDFESGWPEHQARIAKFAVLAVLRLRGDLGGLLAAVPAGEAADGVRTALQGGVLGTAADLAGPDAAAILNRWEEVPAADVAGAADQIAGLRAALAEMAAAHGLRPALAGAAAG